MFFELAKNVNNFKIGLEELVINEMQANSSEICDMNTEQLSRGQYVEGDLITPEYRSETYAKYKKSIGSKAPTGTPDLKNEGDYYAGWYTKPVKEGLEIGSKDEKAAKLERKYSDKTSRLYGLQDKNKAIIGKTVIKKMQDEFTKITDI